MVEIMELYNTLYKITEKLIDVLKREGYHEKHPIKTRSYLLDEHGNWSIGEVPYEHLGPIIKLTDYIDYILSMDEIEKIFDILLSKGFIKYPKFVDSEGNPVENPSKRNILWSGCLHGGVFSLIGRYLDQIPTFDFYPDIFNQCYSDFERYHLSDKISGISTIPLLNFSSDADLVELDDDVKIVRLERDEYTRLGPYMADVVFRRDPNLEDLNDIKRIFESGFAIKINFSLGKDEPISDKFALDKAKQVLTTLRLLKSGDPLWNIYFSEITDYHPKFAPGFSSGCTVPLLPTRQLKERFHLSVEDCTVCKEVWQNLQRLSKHKDQGKLDVGIRKFNDIYDRRLLEDKIIDMSILLESTLLHGIDRELRYRLSLRGAHLLKSNRDPMKTFELLKEFYDIRSEIVHDGKRLSPPVSVGKMQFRPDEFVAEMEDICREVIRAFIEKVAGGVSISRVNEDLDKEALAPPAGSALAIQH